MLEVAAAATSTIDWARLSPEATVAQLEAWLRRFCAIAHTAPLSEGEAMLSPVETAFWAWAS